ncbi:MAG TPA: tetraacyldisaccharide 4'-kinase [Steroidobacteraceae bacterium]|jgi:tetraacyldisaccharide 4'-kinase|nr:tetraacyldisaccharide 4'-kinase [Steroidobacteraceae bacterium]
MSASDSPAMRLQALWYGPRRPPAALRVAAALFAAAVRLRRAAYAHGLLASQRVQRPVIVVGNITVGGSGKTPLVIWLCEQLSALGARPGVVLRGYGGSAERHGEPRLVDADSDAAVVGDEALLLAQRTGAPVVVCRDRVRAARRLLGEGVDVIVADDGLQHLPLARDLELAVIDAARGLGNGYLLPAGPLREPAARLARLDAIVLNGEHVRVTEGTAALAALPPQSVFRMSLQGDRLWPLGRGAPVPLASLAGARVHAVAGIGHPQRFFAQLALAGLQVIAHPFPDHHRYRAEELDFADELPLLMTEKDAVKCRPFAAGNRWFLPVTASFSPAQAAALRERLARCLAARQSQSAPRLLEF